MLAHKMPLNLREPWETLGNHVDVVASYRIILIKHLQAFTAFLQATGSFTITVRK